MSVFACFIHLFFSLSVQFSASIITSIRSEKYIFTEMLLKELGGPVREGGGLRARFERQYVA